MSYNHLEYWWCKKCSRESLLNLRLLRDYPISLMSHLWFCGGLVDSMFNISTGELCLNFFLKKTQQLDSCKLILRYKVIW